ncbi:MAG: hypothetical protein DHS20C09_01930 [marine bacterium B5-7]|nr:MAG: hypothetical protein DHS20C09_01930 [marine bacterium B5-7]
MGKKTRKTTPTNSKASMYFTISGGSFIFLPVCPNDTRAIIDIVIIPIPPYARACIAKYFEIPV